LELLSHHAHKRIDSDDLIRQHARLIVDTRGAYKENFDSLVKA